jgi:tachykinin-like receptor
MAICYTLMGRELWGSRSIGEMTQRQSEVIKSKRKVSNNLKIVETFALLNKVNSSSRRKPRAY